MNGNDPRRYGGFWRRLAATLIDSLLWGIVNLLLLYSLYGPAYFKQMAGDYGVGSSGNIELLLEWVLPALITVFCWVRFFGTPGKLLLGCQVVDVRTGNPVGLSQALLRYFAYLVSLVPLGLGFLWIIWDKRKQGFHDKIAKTVVVLEDESLISLTELERELR